MTSVDLSGERKVFYALKYASMGWYVFPLHWVDGGVCSCGVPECRNAGKHPHGGLARQGQRSATIDEMLIKDWWRREPKCNIGVFLAKSGLVAIDIDPRNGGDATFDHLEAKYGKLDDSVVQLTGGGGKHYLYQLPDGGGNLPGTLGAGVDVKCNGYIVVEPSLHASGIRYGWEASSNPLEGAIVPPLPDWLRSLSSLPTDADHDFVRLSDKDIVNLEEALSYIHNDSRDIWLKVGMGLHNSVGGQRGYAIWVDWSKSSTKFDNSDQWHIWQSFGKNSNVTPLTAKSLFKMARQVGYSDPVVVGDWRHELIVSVSAKGLTNVLARTHNLKLILSHAPEFNGAFSFNSFTGKTDYLGNPLTDVDVSAIKCALEHHISEKISTASVLEAVELVAYNNSYNPLQNWLNSLSWDGVERVKHFFSDHFGAGKTEYAQDVAVSFMVSAVARAMMPGCQVDTMVVLEGKQGTGKSSAIVALVGRDWCSEVISDMDSKDFYQSLRGKWVMDFGELAGLSKHDVNKIKQILTNKVDSYRDSYGRTVKDVARSNIFFGSTNDETYLKDPTGSRRFYPIKCVGDINVKAITDNRNLLWAEAVELFRSGQPWWLVRGAEIEQAMRYDSDTWEEPIKLWLDLNESEFELMPEKLTTWAVLEKALSIPTGKHTRVDQMRVGVCLRRFGYVSKQHWGGGRYYVKKPPD